MGLLGLAATSIRPSALVGLRVSQPPFVALSIPGRELHGVLGTSYKTTGRERLSS